MPDAPCPNCTHPLEARNLGNAVVRFCSVGCRGVLASVDALRGIDHASKGVPKLLEEIVDTMATLTHVQRDPRICPECSAEMIAGPHPKAPDVEIDVCETCRTVFLDGAELAELRDRSLTPAEREEAINQRRRIATRSRREQMYRKRKAARRRRLIGWDWPDGHLFY